LSIPIGDESRINPAEHDGGSIRLRDIRNDLRERLAALDGAELDQMMTYQAERERLDAAHNNALRSIAAERAALKQLLSIEDHRASALPPFTARSAPTIPLGDFLIAKVRACGALEKEELRAAAEEAGYRDGRAFHTTLMNITKGGKLQQYSDGRYAPTALDIFGPPLVEGGEMNKAN
jgi:GAF domain-containing protein